MGSTVNRAWQGGGTPSAFSAEMPAFSILTSLPPLCWLWGRLLGTRSPFPCLLASWHCPRSSSPSVPHPFFTCFLGFQSFFFFLKIFLMWAIFKVFTEFVIILLLFFMFWFFGCEACGILVPLTSDQTRTPCTGR